MLVAVALAMAIAFPCRAAEMAVLRNGFSIRHERRQVIGETTRLFVNADGSNYVDVPTTEIDHFEEAAEIPVVASEATAAKRVTTANSQGVPAFDLNEVVNNASGRYRLDPDLVNSVIKAESGFNVHAVSPKGAQGLMQLMPQTAVQLGVPNPFDPKANVEGGTRYLRELLEHYNFDLVKALAAYNAGPQRVEQYGGVPPFYETRAYVAHVIKDFNKKKEAQGAATDPATKKSATQAPAVTHNATPASSTKPSAASANQ